MGLARHLEGGGVIRSGWSLSDSRIAICQIGSIRYGMYPHVQSLQVELLYPKGLTVIQTGGQPRLRAGTVWQWRGGHWVMAKIGLKSGPDHRPEDPVVCRDSGDRWWVDDIAVVPGSRLVRV